jgi:hypothetical protein
VLVVAAVLAVMARSRLSAITRENAARVREGMSGKAAVFGNHSTVTLLARLRGLSTSQPRNSAM